MSDSVVYSGFAARLKIALDRAGIPDERGRAARISRQLKTSHVAVKKWLDGQGVPDIKHQIMLAQWLNVSFNWLSAGQGDIEVLSLSHEERVQLDAFRKLDARGKQMVRSVTETAMQYAA